MNDWLSKKIENENEKHENGATMMEPIDVRRTI